MADNSVSITLNSNQSLHQSVHRKVRKRDRLTVRPSALLRSKTNINKTYDHQFDILGTLI